MTTTPAQLRAMRERAGLTQAEAGALVHKSAVAWRFWEAGRRPVDETAAHLFARLTLQPYSPAEK